METDVSYWAPGRAMWPLGLPKKFGNDRASLTGTVVSVPARRFSMLVDKDAAVAWKKHQTAFLAARAAARKAAEVRFRQERRAAFSQAATQEIFARLDAVLK